jgi:hypothetical protein
LLFRIEGVRDNGGELSHALGLTPAANHYAISLLLAGNLNDEVEDIFPRSSPGKGEGRSDTNDEIGKIVFFGV